MMKTTMGLDQQYRRMQFYLATQGGTVPRELFHIQNDHYNWHFSSQGLCDSVQADRNKSNARLRTKEALFSSGNNFMLRKAGYKTSFNQKFHKSGGYMGVVHWEVVFRVTAFAPFVN